MLAVVAVLLAFEVSFVAAMIEMIIVALMKFHLESMKEEKMSSVVVKDSQTIDGYKDIELVACRLVEASAVKDFERVDCGLKIVLD